MVLHNNLVLQINFKKEEVKTKPFFSLSNWGILFKIWEKEWYHFGIFAIAGLLELNASLKII